VSHCFASAGLKLTGSSDPPPSTSWVAGTTGACHHAWLSYEDLFFGGTRVWSHDFTLAKQALYCWSHTSVHFALVILEIGSWELFAWTGLEPWSSQSQPLLQLGLQVWTTGTWLIWRLLIAYICVFEFSFESVMLLIFISKMKFLSHFNFMSMGQLWF
jgi:hypothetical protein